MIETPVRRADELPTAARGGPPRYFALAFGPDGQLVAGTCERGVARSDDGGRSWAPFGDVGDAAVNAVVHDGARWWAAAGETGVLRSDDGVEWRPVGSLGGAGAYAVVVDGDRVVAGTDRGIRVWRDGAWNAVEHGPASAVYRLGRAGDGSLVAATEADGVWVERATGWQASGAAEWPVFALDLGTDALLAGTRGGGVLRSTDGGATWLPANDGLPDPVVHVLAREPGGHVLAGTGLGIARSSDGGRSWESLGGELAGHRIFALAVDPDGRIVAGSYEGVWRSDDGVHWSSLDTGLGAQESFAVAFGPGGRAWLGRRAGVDVSDDGGRTWQPGPDDEAGTTLSLHPESDATGAVQLLAGTDHGVRAWTGDAWRDAGLAGMRVRALVSVEAGVMLAGTLGDGVQRRDASGAWTGANDGFPHRSAFDVLVSRRPGVVFVAGGDVVDGRKTGGVFRSEDGGRSWHPTEHEPITTYRVVETSDGTLLAGAQRSCILRSTDGGDTWVATRPEGLVESKLYWLSILSSDRVLLATGPQLLYSDDAGLSWEVGGAGLDGVTVYGIAEGEAGSVLVATSSGAYLSVDAGRSFVATS